MATTAEDIDTMEAFVAYWQATNELYGIAGGLQSGRLKSPQPESYVHIVCTVGQTPNGYVAPMQAGTGYIDYRHVTITGRGTKADMTALAKQLRAHVSWVPRDGKELTFPSGAKLMVIRPTVNPTLDEDDTTKNAKDVWRVRAEYEVATTRTVEE